MKPTATAHSFVHLQNFAEDAHEMFYEAYTAAVTSEADREGARVSLRGIHKAVYDAHYKVVLKPGSE